jgi:hypothetical protein
MKTLLLILALIPCLATAFADEPKPAVMDAEELINQTELSVLTRQYEKALTEYYDSQLQLQLVSTIEGRDDISKEEANRRVEMIELRVKVLQQWREDIRKRIVILVAERNARARERQDKERKAVSSPEKKSASPSERAPAPKF